MGKTYKIFISLLFIYGIVITFSYQNNKNQLNSAQKQLRNIQQQLDSAQEKIVLSNKNGIELKSLLDSSFVRIDTLMSIINEMRRLHKEHGSVEEFGVVTLSMPK